MVIPKGGGKPWVQFYEEQKATQWQEQVAFHARREALRAEVVGEGEELFLLPFVDCRVLASLRFNLRKPKSYPKSVVHAVKKPDLDNLAKAVLDGLVKGRVLADDNYVTDLMLLKRYVDDEHPEGVEIDLTALPIMAP